MKEVSALHLFPRACVYCVTCKVNLTLEIALLVVRRSSIGPILNEGKKVEGKSPETLKGCRLYSLSCVSLCVCLSVRNRFTEHIFCRRNLIFGLNDP